MTTRHASVLTAPFRRTLNANGFTLIDVMMTIVIIGLVSTMAIVQVGQAQQSLKGDGGMRVLTGQLNTARELAISQRRNIQLRFLGVNELDVVRLEVPAGTTTLARIFLEGGVAYGLVPALPDTPDAFGNATPVDFGAAATVMFSSDGTLIDGAGNPVNGTIFLAVPGSVRAARSVTILGATGRVTAYRWDGAKWVRV